jgi:hypothetical protein
VASPRVSNRRARGTEEQLTPGRVVRRLVTGFRYPKEDPGRDVLRIGSISELLERVPIDDRSVPVENIIREMIH